MSDQPRKTRVYGRSAKVLTFLKSSANTILSVSEIAYATGLTTDQVSSTVSHLRNRVGINIELPMRGQYIYHSNPKPSTILPRPNQLYEFVGITRGRTIIRDEQGELYILSPLANLIPKE